MGILYLLPKTKETWNSKNYRPITCISTIYTRLSLPSLSKMTYSFHSKNKLFKKKKKKENRMDRSYRFKGQIQVNKVVLQQVIEKELANNMAQLQEAIWQHLTPLDKEKPQDLENLPLNQLSNSTEKAGRSKRPSRISTIQMTHATK